MMLTGFLQHGTGTDGPFRTERVKIHRDLFGRDEALFEGRWRRVYRGKPHPYILFQGERIAVQIPEAKP